MGDGGLQLALGDHVELNEHGGDRTVSARDRRETAPLRREADDGGDAPGPQRRLVLRRVRPRRVRRVRRVRVIVRWGLPSGSIRVREPSRTD